MLRCIVLLIFTFCFLKTWCSRIKIEKNGYKNILIALPHDVEEDDRPKLVRNVEDMLRSSSILVQMSTKGRAYFSEVTVLVPHSWKIPEDDPLWKLTSFNSTEFLDPRATLTTDETDVIITDKGQYPYVLHQGGCGQRGMRIILPKDFLLRNGDTGLEFVRLWSEYRYGVFPEGGFQDDEKYPVRYRTPDGKEEKSTGCGDKTFWSSSLCDEGDKHCSDNSYTSSVMDQHLSSSAIMFCEGDVSLGPRHNSESPSKHNLLCKQEGTWFTVMRSPDFSHGKNTAPKYLRHANEVLFRFVKEAASPRIIVAIEISSRMKSQKRYFQTQAAFYQFVYSVVPYGSELILFTFGGEERATIAKQSTVLKSEDSRILYIESQPLPEDVSDMNNVSLSQLFSEIFQTMEDSNVIQKASPNIIIVTTESHLNATAYEEVKQKISETESQLNIMLFPEDGENMVRPEPSLQDLCSETGGKFILLHADSFGDMNRGFGKSLGIYNKEVQILQSYLKEDDDVNLEIPFLLDESLTENLRVSLSFPYLDIDHLHYRKTVLQTPSGSFLNFMKLDFLFAWEIDLTKPEAGEYILKTRRMEDVTAPVLITVTGRPSTSEDPITVNVWTETLTDFDTIPQPVRIYAEIKKGWSPVRGAQVTASVRHPTGETSQLTLLDDGLGDIDITKDDGIYGRYFTNFTSPGYYNVYVKVTQGVNITEVVTGPYGFCCGSYFSAVTAYSVGRFQREAGPFTFGIPHTEDFSDEDKYPPSRVTDLTFMERYDRICVLHWTAVGDDYDSGFAETYELKVFRDMAIIRNRFSGSGQELYSEIIAAIPEATYGTILNHAFELPSNLKGGIYYIALRGIDDAGNAGEPSNVVSVSIDQTSSTDIDCENDEDTCENDVCEELPRAEKLQENSAINIISGVMTITFIPTNVLFPLLSLTFSLIVLNIL